MIARAAAPEPAEVVLVSMPWTVTRAPSIQLGILKALLDRAGLGAATVHAYVDFFDAVARRLGGRRLSVDTYDGFGEFFGEWVFSVPPFRQPGPDDDEAWRAVVADQRPREWIDAAFRVRALVPAFLTQLADEILARQPRVVGFSTTFQQNVPSLALSKLLKERDPGLRIVFGGANCEGEMGEAIHRLFPWVDVVVRGEAESIVPRLFRQLVSGVEPTPQPGLCLRIGDRAIVVPEQLVDDREDRPASLVRPARLAPRAAANEPAPAPSPTPMDEVPLPVYDDYFARAERTALAAHLDRHWLPYESARGCWWALKHICTFCAANAQFLSFRSKQPERVMSDVVALSRRHGTPHVWFVDNIMDERYLRELFPRMRRAEHGVSMFVETRAHVSREQLRAMRDAGVIMVQLGVESFSSPILALMDKGTTAIQNVRVLKWAAELGIQCFYNLIYGFPGEAPAEYDQMADRVLSLAHLEPPNLPVRLRLDRFSPYFRDPGRFGIEKVAPRPSRRFVYGVSDDELARLEYFFTFAYADGRDPDGYVGRFIESCARWKRDWPANANALTWHDAPEGAVIVDRRSTTTPARHLLGPLERKIYLRCDAGAASERVWQSLDDGERGKVTPAEVEALLVRWTAARLMFEEDGKYLSLALTMAQPPDAAARALPVVRHACGMAAGD